MELALPVEYTLIEAGEPFLLIDSGANDGRILVYRLQEENDFCQQFIAKLLSNLSSEFTFFTFISHRYRLFIC